MDKGSKQIVPTLEEDDGIPIGWEDVRFTEEEADALVFYAERGEIEKALEIVDSSYARLFGEQTN